MASGKDLVGSGGGSGSGSRECSCGGILSQRVWTVCLVLGIIVAAVHMTASQTSAMTKSLRGWQTPWHTAEMDNDSASPKLPSIPVAEPVEELKPQSQVAAPERHQNQSADQVAAPEQQLQSADKPQVAVNSSVTKKVRKPLRVAICLVGGARSFELTGLSIKKHVLDVYNRSEVFLHVPFDKDAHKLTLLKGASNLAMARVFENDHVPESAEAQEVLTAANSPNGIQGLLQYFRLVQGCLTMISAYENKHDFKYDWIVRTRVDGYWSGDLPRLGSLHSNYYHVPYGSSFGGLNDRLGIGTRNTSWAALSRLSLIPKLYTHGYRLLNSEQSFRGQLNVSGVKVKLHDFRFCILTSRKYAWPPAWWGVPVASIRSKGALNGAKCKPCHTVASGEAARAVVSRLNPGWGWIHPVKDLQLCNASHDLRPGWQSMFDEVSGPELAHVRRRVMNRTEEECIQEVTQFGKLWENWDAPPSEALCKNGSAT